MSTHPLTHTLTHSRTFLPRRYGLGYYSPGGGLVSDFEHYLHHHRPTTTTTTTNSFPPPRITAAANTNRAGAQPREEDALDPEFLQRLHAVLDLCDDNDINVLLDNHGDMVGSAGCGNGVPMWFQQKVTVETALPYLLSSSFFVHIRRSHTSESIPGPVSEIHHVSPH